LLWYQRTLPVCRTAIDTARHGGDRLCDGTVSVCLSDCLCRRSTTATTCFAAARRRRQIPIDIFRLSSAASRQRQCCDPRRRIDTDSFYMCMNSKLRAPINKISHDDLTIILRGSAAEWLACWTQAQKARVLIAVATLSGNSLRQTAHTHCSSVRQAAKLVVAVLRVAGITAGLAESNGSLPPGL